MAHVVLAGGGTAGHTSPLIATAERIAELDPTGSIVAVGTARGLETTVVPAAGLRLELIPPVPLPRMGKCAEGSTKSTDEKEVNSIDQPPLSSGSREARRVTVVPQSLSTMSALKPSRRTRSAVAGTSCTAPEP